MAKKDDKDAEEKKDILDFHSSLVKKLQSDLTCALQTQDDIAKGSRIYWQRVHAVHQAVITLLEAHSLKDLIERLQDEACPILGFDAAQLYLSFTAPERQALPLVRPIPPSFASGKEKETFLVTDAELMEQLFQGQGGLLAIAMGLPLQAEGFRGLMVIGSRDENRFDAGLAYEPYIFLARAMERMIIQCLQRA